MNYYYDIILNFDSENVWEFYEWQENDNLSYVQKIPLFRVSFETIQDFLTHYVTLSSDFVQSIIHKTMIRNHSEECCISFLMGDSKNSLAVLLDEDGKVLSLSKLLISDENNLNEFMYTLKESEIPYEMQERRNIAHPMRQKEKMKDFILVELNTLLDEQNFQKLKYLYYEWFQQEGTDMNFMYHEMVQALNCSSENQLSHIDYLIRLSYHQV